MAALLWPIGQGGEWQVNWSLWKHNIIYDVKSLWLFNFFLLYRTLKQEPQGKEKSGKRDQEKFDNHALLNHKAVMDILLIPQI